MSDHFRGDPPSDLRLPPGRERRRPVRVLPREEQASQPLLPRPPRRRTAIPARPGIKTRSRGKGAGRSETVSRFLSVVPRHTQLSQLSTLHSPLPTLLLALFVHCGAALAAEPVPTTDPAFAAVATPEQDDATLRAVAFAGPALGVAVGDRGVVWRTTDGGRHWEFRAAGIDAVLTGVSLLDSRTGFAVGSLTAPYTGVSQGVVLRTDDGGRSWMRVDHGALPPLTAVRFFTAERGCAAGQGDVRHPSAVLTTEDGGQTWTAAPGPRVDGWTAAAFLDPKHGVLVGRRGGQGTLGNGRLLRVRAAAGLRTMHAVALLPNGRGWLAGDGGLLRTTEDAGVSWPEPPTPLPESARDWHDLRSVAAFGSHVWTAGSPGSLVWHSPDGGVTWHAQATGDPAPIEALAFFSPLEGCAVGAFGQIRMTWDGGETWQSVRGGRRRPALLTVHGEAAQLCWPLLTRESGEYGYRSVALVLTRRDIGTDASAHRGGSELLRAQMLAAGGNAAELDWRLPLRSPDLAREREKLVDDWLRLHEQKFRDVFLGGLVAAIRTWRPEVVIVDQASPQDAVTGLLHEALPLALEQAADPRQYPGQASLGLSPWSVSKVFVRLPAGESGGVTIEPFQPLPRLGTTLHQAASRAAACGRDAPPPLPQRESFRLWRVSPELAPPGGADPSDSPLARSFFAGLTLPPGGEVRRSLPPLQEVQEEQLLVLARHQRNFAGYAQQMLDDPQRAGQLIAQLRETVRPLPRDEAARLLADLADEYRRRAQWDFVEQTLVELVEQFPEQPPARAAMRWLLARWTSQEILWQHLRRLSVEAATETLNPQVLQANFQQALEAVREAENSLEAELRINALPSPLETTRQSGVIQLGRLSTVASGSDPRRGGFSGAGANQVQAEIARRWRQARRVADLLPQVDPTLAVQPEVQFVLAALHRAQQRVAPAAEIYRNFYGLDEGIDPWHLTARGELWITSRGPLSPKPVLRCARAARPPLLDGLLTDDCWSTAGEVHLRANGDAPSGADPTFVGSQRLDTEAAARDRPAASEERAAIVMLAYDDRHLYIAASVPRHPAVTPAAVQRAGRIHDAELESQDRLRLCLDVDRDYATYYRLEVDQRGAVRDALWDDPTWNPKWYVAAEADADHWRIEAAIPWEQLVPAPPSKGTVWAGEITRLVPAVGLQSWTAPAGETIRPETFGLILFD